VPATAVPGVALTLAAIGLLAAASEVAAGRSIAKRVAGWGWTGPAMVLFAYGVTVDIRETPLWAVSTVLGVTVAILVSTVACVVLSERGEPGSDDAPA
jgi:hypothetical protein